MLLVFVFDCFVYVEGVGCFIDVFLLSTKYSVVSQSFIRVFPLLRALFILRCFLTLKHVMGTTLLVLLGKELLGTRNLV